MSACSCTPSVDGKVACDHAAPAGHVGSGGGRGQRRDGDKGEGDGEPESHVGYNARGRRSLWKGSRREPRSGHSRRRGGWRARGGAVVARPPVRLPVQPALLGAGAASADHARAPARGARAAARRARARGRARHRLLHAGRGASRRLRRPLHVFDVQQEMLDHTMRRGARARAWKTSQPCLGDARELPYPAATLRRRLPRHGARRDPRPGRRAARARRVLGPAAGWSSASCSATRTWSPGRAAAPRRGGRPAVRAAGRLAARLLRGAARVKSVGCRP